MTYVEAVEFVRTAPMSGLAQAVLVHAVKPLEVGDSVLEIGCGTLFLAKALLPCVATYDGMDPNEWLRDVARAADPVLDELCIRHRARFSSRDDFDARAEWGEVTYSVVVAHSVLSHVGRDQLDQFFAAVRPVLGTKGVLLASYNWAGPSARDETIAADWTYPYGVTISDETLYPSAAAAGLRVERVDHLARLYRSWCPRETHDWLVGIPA